MSTYNIFVPPYFAYTLVLLLVCTTIAAPSKKKLLWERITLNMHLCVFRNHTKKMCRYYWTAYYTKFISFLINILYNLCYNSFPVCLRVVYLADILVPCTYPKKCVFFFYREKNPLLFAFHRVESREYRIGW